MNYQNANMEIAEQLKLLRTSEVEADIRIKLETASEKIEAVIDEFGNQVEKINSNPELNEIGKEARKADLVQGLKLKLDAMVNPFKKEIESVQKALKTNPPANTTEALLDFLKQQEIRQHMLSMENENERVGFFFKNVENLETGRLAVDAVEQSPFYLIDPEHVERGRAIREKIEQPALYARFEGLQHAEGVFNVAMRAALSSLGWREDPLKEVLEASA